MPESVHPEVVVRTIESRDLELWYQYLTLQAVFQHTSWSLTSADELATYIWSPETFEPGTKTRSARVLDRCGLEKEGLLRQHRMVRGTPGNFFMYSHIA